VYKSVDGRIELKEIGPRFELFGMFFCFTLYVNLYIASMYISSPSVL